MRFAPPSRNEKEGTMKVLEQLREKLMLLTHDPICDIEDTKSHRILSFDLPNMKSDDFDVSAVGRVLVVKVKRNHSCPSAAPDAKVIECHHHSFSREYQFPVALNPEKIDAYYQGGVLRIAVPKNSLLLKQQIPISNTPRGFFSPGQSPVVKEPIEAFSDLDDYDWE